MSSYKEFLDKYFTQIVKITDEHEQITEQRMFVLRDTILKYLIQNISYIKNIEYDLNNTSKRLENY